MKNGLNVIVLASINPLTMTLNVDYVVLNHFAKENIRKMSNKDKDVKKLYRKYKADKIIAEKDEMCGLPYSIPLKKNRVRKDDST